jgi:hypothetical protein
MEIQVSRAKLDNKEQQATPALPGLKVTPVRKVQLVLKANRVTQALSAQLVPPVNKVPSAPLVPQGLRVIKALQGM